MCRSGGAFGFICEVLGSNLGCLGLVLGSSGAPFWRSGGAFALIFRLLGSTLGCLGVHVGRSGGILGAVGGLFGVRGRSVGRRSYHFGSIFDGFRMDFRDPNHSGIHVFFFMIF